MKKIVLLLLLSFFMHCAHQCYAQYDDVPLPKSLRNTKPAKAERKLKMMAGGTFGAQFGSYTAVSLSPMFGIYPVDWLLLGVGGTYMYSYEGYYGLSSHVYGGTAFIEGLIWKQRIILHAGYEYINYDQFYMISGSSQIYKERVGSHAILLGPGYRQPVSESVNIYALLLFNVIQNYNSFFANPIIRIGVTFDF